MAGRKRDGSRERPLSSGFMLGGSDLKHLIEDLEDSGQTTWYVEPRRVYVDGRRPGWLVGVTTVATPGFPDLTSGRYAIVTFGLKSEAWRATEDRTYTYERLRIEFSRRPRPRTEMELYMARRLRELSGTLDDPTAN